MSAFRRIKFRSTCTPRTDYGCAIKVRTGRSATGSSRFTSSIERGKLADFSKSCSRSVSWSQPDEFTTTGAKPLNLKALNDAAINGFPVTFWVGGNQIDVSAKKPLGRLRGKE